MNVFSWLAQRRAWKRAKRLHAYEHAAKIETTLSCDAVGHWDLGDTYGEVFDGDQRRKFELATGGKW